MQCPSHVAFVRFVVARPKKPAEHSAVQFGDARPVVLPNVPAAQRALVAFVDPAAHQWPTLQGPSHVSVVRTDVALPKKPAAHGAVQLGDARPVVRPNVPAAQRAYVAFVDPAAHQWPTLQRPSHVAAVRTVAAVPK